MKETEIELQAKIEHVEPLLSFLDKEGKFQFEKRQVDQYFTPAHRDFLSKNPIEEWLRLRDSSGAYSLNYKKWHFDGDGRGLYADEYETKLENFQMAEKILVAVDVKPLVVVDKNRKVWLYADYEISLDSVKDLGDFVEIEYKGQRDSSEHKEILEEMVGFLKKLGCGAIEMNHSGYPALLLGRGGRTDVL